MHVLGIDTSRTTAGVVVARHGAILACLAQGGGSSASATVLSLIDNALSLSSITIDKIGFIAIAEGPGSFTGLRVGFGTALGLGHALGLEVMGIGSLDAMARSLMTRSLMTRSLMTRSQAGWDGGYIVPMESSRRGEVFAALYTVENGALKKLTDEMAIKPSELAAMIDGPARFVGSGFLQYETLLRSEIKSEIEFADVDQESFTHGLAQMALEKFEADGIGEGVTSPRYVSRSQAEINLEKRKN